LVTILQDEFLIKTVKNELDENELTEKDLDKLFSVIIHLWMILKTNK
jgi:hypothetical protein